MTYSLGLTENDRISDGTYIIHQNIYFLFGAQTLTQRAVNASSQHYDE